MRKTDFYYDSQPKSCSKFVLLLILVIFSFTVTTFAVFEIGNFYSDEANVKHILIDGLKSFKNLGTSKNSNHARLTEGFKNLEKQKAQKKLLASSNNERPERAAADNNTTSLTQKSNSYYEEQKPVVVYSKTDTDSSIELLQMAEEPPKQDDADEDPYSKAYDDGDYESSDDDYFGQSEPKQPQADDYYRKSQEQQEQSSPSYYRQQPATANYYSQPQTYYRQADPSSSYYDDSKEDFSGPEAVRTNSQEARASQYQARNSYYRQYQYATPSPLMEAGRDDNKRITVNGNRNMQMSTKNQGQQPQYRDRYPSYMDDYEYLPPNYHSPAAAQPPYINRKSPPQRAQYRTPSIPSPAEEKQETGQQMDFLTMFKHIKTMWDLYQSFTSSWNTIAERRNREEQLARQKYKQQQQIRINSKKPPKFNTRRNTTVTTKSPRKQLNTITTTTKTRTDFPAEDEGSNKKEPLAKVEPRKGTKTRAKNEDGPRDKRQAADGLGDSTSVGEGRYIKGDPLKGYYDFVITEGSYKFWAAFQVGTAILIIYSTFAAIYYSKVNPLVSDYDYTDYLGGARSLSGGDVDFVDDVDEESGAKNTKTKGWLEWLPRSGHSLKFILEAIDKLPTDHAGGENRNDSYFKENSEVKAESAPEYTDNEFESEVGSESSNEKQRTNGSKEFSNERESLSNTGPDNEAM